ncbi:MAG: sterol desaturase family protein [Pseudomonadota bacterium]
MDLVIYAPPFFIAAMLLELWWGRRQQRNTYRTNDAVGSLFLGSLSQARKFVTLGVGGYVYHLVAEHYAIAQLSSTSIWTWVLATFLYDFCYYWLHRLGHERTILWAAHVAHHQSEDYNLSTALRQTSTGFLLGWIFYVPMFALGIPATVVVTVGSINLLYQFWVHTEHVGKLGWFEWVFVTPSNHRVHHAQNEIYLDRNYGGLFIIWDRLFGTFQEELEDEPPIFGIRGALKSFNPVKALTHIYRDMALDSFRTKRWSDKLRVWVSRTGWRPDDVMTRYPREKTNLARFERFDPVIGSTARYYALFQLVAVVVLLGYLQMGIASSYAIGAALAGCMLFMAVCTSFWLDAQPVVFSLVWEVLRLALFTLVLAVGSAALQVGFFIEVASGYLIANAVWLFLLFREGAKPLEDERPMAVAGMQRQ